MNPFLVSVCLFFESSTLARVLPNCFSLAWWGCHMRQQGSLCALLVSQCFTDTPTPSQQLATLMRKPLITAQQYFPLERMSHETTGQSLCLRACLSAFGRVSQFQWLLNTSSCWWVCQWLHCHQRLQVSSCVLQPKDDQDAKHHRTVAPHYTLKDNRGVFVWCARAVVTLHMCVTYFRHLHVSSFEYRVFYFFLVIQDLNLLNFSLKFLSLA